MKNHTDITVLLDRSGSMGAIKDDVIGGFNEFVEGQKKAGKNASLTLVQFDDVSIDNVHTATPISGLAKLTDETYQPRGNTPLLDALGKTIHATGERLAAIGETERPDKVVFVVVTDGQENASHEYTKLAVKALIEQQTTAYNWQFVYLGANQDSFYEAGQVGFAAAVVADFAIHNMAPAMRSVSANVASYRASNDVRKLAYSDEQRQRLKQRKP